MLITVNGRQVLVKGDQLPENFSKRVATPGAQNVYGMVNILASLIRKASSNGTSSRVTPAPSFETGEHANAISLGSGFVASAAPPGEEDPLARRTRLYTAAVEARQQETAGMTVVEQAVYMRKGKS